MRDRRFLVEPSALGEGRAIVAGSEHRHLAKVLRLSPGDEIVVFDGRGRGFRGRIRAVERDRTLVDLGEEEPSGAEPYVRLSVLQALLHTDRMESIVEKVTEIGASDLVPVVGARSVARPAGRRWGRLERLRRIAASASKQSGRLVIPEVHEPVTFEEALAWGPPDRDDALRIILHPGGEPLPAVLARAGSPAAVHLLVGPEGGWTGEEVGRAAEAGWIAAGLGPRTLRADTAAVVAAGLAMTLLLVPPKP